MGHSAVMSEWDGNVALVWYSGELGLVARCAQRASQVTNSPGGDAQGKTVRTMLAGCGFFGVFLLAPQAC